MRLCAIDATWNHWPTQYEFVGMILLPDGELPSYLLIDNVVYKRKESSED